VRNSGGMRSYRDDSVCGMVVVISLSFELKPRGERCLCVPLTVAQSNVDQTLKSLVLNESFEVRLVNIW